MIPFACFLLLDETKEKDETNESINVELFTTITIKGKVYSEYCGWWKVFICGFWIETRVTFL